MYMITIPQRHRQTDGRTTRLDNTALRISSRGKRDDTTTTALRNSVVAKFEWTVWYSHGKVSGLWHTV